MSIFFNQNKTISIQLSDIKIPASFKADIVEFICIISKDKRYSLSASQDDIEDYLSLSEDSIEESSLDDIKSFRNNLEEDYEFFSKDESINIDRAEEIAELIFEALEYRNLKFRDDYPFMIEKKSIKLKNLDFNSCTVNQKLYLSTLVSSLFAYATNYGITTLGGYFEALCEPFFRYLVPSNATVKHFGSGVTTTGEAYIGNIHNKIYSLANDLKCSPKEDAIRQLSVNSVGDNGLDWVAFLSFDDDYPYFPVFFAQCTCGKEWKDKQFEIHSHFWENFIDLKPEPVTVFFVPKSSRKSDGSIYNSHQILKNIIFIDRDRMFEIIKKNNFNLSSSSIIENYRSVIEEIFQYNIDNFD
jgi:hypothetical protein